MKVSEVVMISETIYLSVKSSVGIRLYEKTSVVSIWYVMKSKGRNSRQG